MRAHGAINTEFWRVADAVAKVGPDQLDTAERGYTAGVLAALAWVIELREAPSRSTVFVKLRRRLRRSHRIAA